MRGKVRSGKHGSWRQRSVGSAADVNRQVRGSFWIIKCIWVERGVSFSLWPLLRFKPGQVSRASS